MQNLQLANPITKIIQAVEEQGVTGFRQELHRGRQGKVLLHFNLRSSLVLEHFPNVMPSLCMLSLTIARLEGDTWVITTTAEEAQQWLTEAGSLLGDPADDYGKAERRLVG